MLYLYRCLYLDLLYEWCVEGGGHIFHTSWLYFQFISPVLNYNLINQIHDTMTHSNGVEWNEFMIKMHNLL